MTTVSDGFFQYGGAPVTPGLPAPFTGNAWFVDPSGGSDGYTGKSPKRAFATLYQAYTKAADGNDDVIYLLGNGLSTGTARLSTALAQGVVSTATTGTLTWAKNALHLVGVSAGGVNPRARIAPPIGTYTQATFASGNFIVVSGNGCYFSNVAIYNGFSTGGAAQVALTVTGQRNVFNNVVVQGMTDAASAADTGSRNLVVGGAGAGENEFINCIIGDDTIPRTVANASLELTGGTPRNIFTGCVFPEVDGAAGACLTVLGTGASCIDRYTLFTNCTFINSVKSGGTASAVLVSLTSASPGGLLVFQACDAIGFTKMGDTNALANTYVSNVGGAATASLDVHPS